MSTDTSITMTFTVVLLITTVHTLSTTTELMVAVTPIVLVLSTMSPLSSTTKLLSVAVTPTVVLLRKTTTPTVNQSTKFAIYIASSTTAFIVIVVKGLLLALGIFLHIKLFKNKREVTLTHFMSQYRNNNETDKIKTQIKKNKPV